MPTPRRTYSPQDSNQNLSPYPQVDPQNIRRGLQKYHRGTKHKGILRKSSRPTQKIRGFAQNRLTDYIPDSRINIEADDPTVSIPRFSISRLNIDFDTILVEPLHRNASSRCDGTTITAEGVTSPGRFRFCVSDETYALLKSKQQAYADKAQPTLRRSNSPGIAQPSQPSLRRSSRLAEKSLKPTIRSNSRSAMTPYKGPQTRSRSAAQPQARSFLPIIEQPQGRSTKKSIGPTKSSFGSTTARKSTF